MLNINYAIQFKLPFQTEWFTFTGKDNFFYLEKVMKSYRQAYPQFDYRLVCFA